MAEALTVVDTPDKALVAAAPASPCLRNDVADSRLNSLVVPADMVAVANRTRDIPPKELPTFGMKPKVFREGQMIGEFESKQDLYLTFAHRCNDLQAQIDKLTEELLKLKPN